MNHIITYPKSNWNTFADLATIELVMGSQFPLQYTEFSKLSNDLKYASLTNAGMWIRTCKGLKLPHILDQDIIIAQVAIMASTLNQDPLSHDPYERAITKEKVGSIEVSYDPKYKTDPLDINPLIYRLLSPFGCSGSTGFTQSKVH